MNGHRQSDGPVVPANPPNKATAAEVGEGRGSTKGNTTSKPHPGRSAGPGVSHALDRVRQAAARDKKARFTALLHHVSIDRLRAAYRGINPKAAPGVDEVTWAAYGQDLENNLRDLHRRVHSGAYRASPSRRAYIPKADGRLRPLGIATLEDKIVQRAVVEVLNALDADIRDFFGQLDHAWLRKFLEHRIADERVLRLIGKWLAAGVIEDGKRAECNEGSPQGASVSPLLANVYLHYVLDLWADHWRRQPGRGDVIIVRWADDFIVGFERRDDAERFLVELRQRLARFGLDLHPDKTRLIEFGRYAADRRARRGLGKPETFTFLGFTHICARSKNGRFWVRRKTNTKRMQAKLKQVKDQIKRRRHLPIPEQGRWLASVVRGHQNYYAVPGNSDAVSNFRDQVTRHWYKALRRRSQRTRITWARMHRIATRWLPRTRDRHPFPQARFAATHPR